MNAARTFTRSNLGPPEAANDNLPTKYGYQLWADENPEADNDNFDGSDLDDYEYLQSTAEGASDD